MHKHKRLTNAYRFSGFTPSQTVKAILGDPKAREIMLKRRQKNNLPCLWSSTTEFIWP